MEFQYPFATTGIGSFPHQDEKQLSNLILENFPEIPFWPQLPKRSFLEGMVVQYSEGFPCLRWNEQEKRVWIEASPRFWKEIEVFYQRFEEGDLGPFQITEDFAKGLRILEDLSSEDQRKKIKHIKSQITGPISFGLSLADQEQKPVFYDLSLRDIVVKHLSLKARWLEKKMNELFPGVPTITFFDEPSLAAFGSAFSGLNREDVILSLNECLDAVKGLKGVHCCGNTDWGVLLSAHLDILSFDAYDYLETLSLYPKDLKAFLEKGGVLAWGIVPTTEAIIKEDVQTLHQRLKKQMETLSQKGIDPSLLHKQAILTPSCGMGLLSVPLAEKVCRLTAELSKMLRSKED